MKTTVVAGEPERSGDPERFGPLARVFRAYLAAPLRAVGALAWKRIHTGPR